MDQRLQQLRRQHDIAILLPLSLLDTNDHPPPIDRGRFEVKDFGDTQTRRVTGRQDGTMLDAFYAVEEQHDFLRAEHDGELFWCLGSGDDVLKYPVLLECDPVEKPQC